MTDHWTNRLSEYLDRDLGPAEHEACAHHLEHCAACRDLARDLMALKQDLAQLADPPPPHDLWPGIAKRLPSKSGERAWLRPSAWLLAALLAGVLLALPWWWQRPPEGAEQRFLLLLTASAAAPRLDAAESDRRVAEYSRWARRLLSLGVLIDAAELSDDRTRALGLRAAEPGEMVAGFFLLRAQSEGEALSLARECPHLKYGGAVELLPVVPLMHNPRP